VPTGSPPARGGSRIGLRNVADRLVARFGSAGAFDTTMSLDRFRAEIRLPWTECCQA
jgi:two-component system, LytTR family, sensor kinase